MSVLRHRIILLLVALIVCIPRVRGQAHSTATVGSPLCLINKQPLTAYGFSMAALQSLWYVNMSIKEGTPANDNSTKEADNVLSLLTGMMRDVKLGTNDFICAKQMVEPFVGIKAVPRTVTPYQAANIALSVRYYIKIYEDNIELNNRLLTLLKNLPKSSNTGELSDQLSTFQVKRGELWDELPLPTTLALGMLVDMRPTDEHGNFIHTDNSSEGHTMRLLVTKAQKKALLDWLGEHFPELTDGTPEANQNQPAKVAGLYITLLSRRMCSDE